VSPYPMLFRIGLGLRRDWSLRGAVVWLIFCLSRMVLVVLSATQLIAKNEADDSEKNGISEGHRGKDKYVLR
jgi:hypothetical protein